MNVKLKMADALPLIPKKQREEAARLPIILCVFSQRKTLKPLLPQKVGIDNAPL